jgi:hypothetical protein
VTKMAARERQNLFDGSEKIFKILMAIKEIL